MAEIRVKSASVDKKRAVLYLENGEKRIVTQGDYRLVELMERIVKICNSGQIAVVDIDEFSAYAHFQEKTNGLVKFFRIAKAKIAHLFDFGIPEDSDTPVAQVVHAEPKISEPVAPAPRPTTEEILKDAQPVTDDMIGSEETVVAQVGDKIIPNAEKLRDHVVHSVKTKNTIGLQKLIERMAAMTGTAREHSVNDLVRFLERADLPIANDGSIIAYKRITEYTRNQKRKTEYLSYWFDVHSGNVPQRVGSEVRVAEDLVDKNRRNECSNGLHIARRGYLGSFSGEVTVLVRINPEDVITVPHNDPNKVRVCAYHIVGRLSPEATEKVIRNKPMTDNPEAARLVAAAMDGTHIGILERTEVLTVSGTEVKVTKFSKGKIQDIYKTPEELAKARAIDDAVVAAVVDPKKLNQEIADHDAQLEAEALKATEQALVPESEASDMGTEPEPDEEDLVEGSEDYDEAEDPAPEITEKPKTKAQLAQEAYEAGDYAKVREIKKAAKVSYARLGFSHAAELKLTGDQSNPAPVAKETPKKADKPATSRSKGIPSPKVTKDAAAKPKASKPAKDESPAEEQTEQAKLFIASKWKELWDLKRKRKVSWTKLGFTPDAIDLIEKNKPE